MRISLPLPYLYLSIFACHLSFVCSFFRSYFTSPVATGEFGSKIKYLDVKNNVKRFNEFKLFSILPPSPPSSSEFDTSGISFSESSVHNLRLFQEYATKGIELFKKRDLKGAIQCLQEASAVNGTQPNAQLGIFLYCDERFEDAEAQLASDIKKIESSKSFKATDLRIWRSACMNKLGRTDDSIQALDLLNIAVPEAKEDRILMNYTLSFFGREKSLEQMIAFIEAVTDNDFTGRKFYGNFYLGLFYDSIGEFDMAKLFLSFPCKSRKFSDKDMWFHLPRMLFDCRFKSDDEEET